MNNTQKEKLISYLEEYDTLTYEAGEAMRKYLDCTKDLEQVKAKLVALSTTSSMREVLSIDVEKLREKLKILSSGCPEE